MIAKSASESCIIAHISYFSQLCKKSTTHFSLDNARNLLKPTAVSNPAWSKATNSSSSWKFVLIVIYDMALCFRSTEESHVPSPFLQNMKLVLAQPVQQTSNAGPPSCALPSNHLETGGDFAPKKKGRHETSNIFRLVSTTSMIRLRQYIL